MRLSPLRWLSAQLRRPHGFIGEELVGRALNRVNRRVVDLSIAALDVREGQRVLDVGFGGGYELSALCARVRIGEVVGVDVSQDLVAHARRHHAAAVRAGRLDLRVADVAALPFPDETFERALCANGVYFWDDPVAVFRELRRVLAPGGRLAVSLRTRAKMDELPITLDGYTFYEPEEVSRLAERAGFATRQVQHLDRERLLDCAIVLLER